MIKIRIATKLFLGFLGIICLNVFFVLIVSKLSSLNSIASILKKQNEIKNNFLQISSLHSQQERSRLIYSTISKDESAENFLQKGVQINTILDSVLTSIDAILLLDSAVSAHKSYNPDILRLKETIEKNISVNSAKYNEKFADFLAAKKNNNIPASQLLDTVIDTADSNFKAGIEATHSLIDSQNMSRIKEIEKRIDNVRNLTQLILLGMSIFSIGFALLFSRAISNSLRKLKESTSSIAKGNFDFNPHGYPNDEIGELAHAFFEMAYDLKKAQEELIKKRRLAAIGEIVASVNHEINNPLMIISGNAQFLEMTIDNGITDDTKERIHAIIEETERISQVTRKLRDIKNPVVEDYTSSGEQMINLDKSIDSQ